MKRLLRALALLLLASLPTRAMDEVPYVVTPDNVTSAMVQLANIGPEDYVIDLGSGDGRIVIAAAKRGARGLGIEIVPELVAKSRANARAAGVASRAFFREQDLFKTDLSPASVITMYLLPEVNLQLRPRILQLRPGTRIVSHDWDMGEWQPDKSLILDAPDKPIGREKSSKLYLWVVPARIQGDYCGIGKAKGTELRLAQQFQRFRGQLNRGGESQEFEGRISGSTISSPRNLNLFVEGDKLRVQAINKKYSHLHRSLFARQRGSAC